jgi:hypothetical protein
MKEVVPAALSMALILSPGFSTNLMAANALNISRLVICHPKEMKCNYCGWTSITMNLPDYVAYKGKWTIFIM